MESTEQELEELRRRARQEAAAAWKGVESAAYVFGCGRREYMLHWINNVYGDLGLESEDL